MPGATVKRPVARVTLVKEKGTRELIKVLLNPNSLRQQQQADWTQHVVVGLPYEPLQYTHTRPMRIQAQFYLSAFEMTRINPNADFAAYDAFRRFIAGALYPTQLGKAPSPIIFVWPNVAVFRGVVKEVSFNYVDFLPSGVPAIYTADVSFVEIRGLRTDNEVRDQGFTLSFNSVEAKEATEVSQSKHRQLHYALAPKVGE